MTTEPSEQHRLSIGLGDRFGREGEAQLAAVQQFSREYGIPVIPVWNKSQREHALTGTHPRDTRREADEAVTRLGWQDPYYVDADHVSAATLEPFLPYCDYFTIDVAHLLDAPFDPAELDELRELLDPWCRRRISLPAGGVLELQPGTAAVAARRYGRALDEIAQVVGRLRRQRPGDCRIEISADEVGVPQSPAELFCLLALLAARKIAVDALAPRFPGAFLKGIDYRGDLRAFAIHLQQVVGVLEFARREFGWRELRLSVHSGSDKSSLYPILHRCAVAAGGGLHLKTAGTTWLEEVAALAEVEPDGWSFVRELYRKAWRRRAELVQPYAAVVDIREERLPDPEAVATWSGRQFAAALRPSAASPPYHEDLRQLVHIAYPLAAEAGDEFHDLLERYRDRIAPRVTENLYGRHLVAVFGGGRRS
ncbi:MAG: tagaturonate epimerase family protein [Acidobacteriota bacterium]